MDQLKARLSLRIPLTKALSILEGQIPTRIESMQLTDAMRREEAQSSEAAHPKYGFMTSSERTEELARTLRVNVAKKVKCGHMEEVYERRDPDTLTMELMALRRQLDRLGIPYGFFAVEALRSLVNWTGSAVVDVPSIKRLMEADVIDAVANKWNAELGTGTNDCDITTWDRKFFLKKNHGSKQHLAMVAFASSQIRACEDRGGDGSRLLKRYVAKKAISVEDAMRELGVDLVDRAEKPADPMSELDSSL